ncbi:MULTISPECIES: protein-export chaperone SecB [Thiorhodovibrio]|uniref:protein-export chaperone SecB n=1 Tax=Thiorhodovibrio TaxID=61593 RepID=UPI0019112837|nr:MULTISPECIES: protein-export chaperone SecB [Thiorhodovibrio]MBK5971063.1 protein-export chaperone SecB [Thiorhodovibrio winogradskyi]WPL10570.1 Protein-export protein SecB [Thiorhodovibrio litoralis]
MAEKDTPEQAPNAAPEQQQAQDHQVLIRTIYTKDLSYEGPNVPEIFRDEWKPEVALQFDIKVNPLVEDTFEVVLTLTVTVKVGEKTAYLVELQQAGILSVKGFKEEELAPLFYVYAPSVLFPYARQTVTDLVAKGGFPHLVLQHIHFDQVYAQKVAEQQAAAGTKPH